jgi:transcriptional regulator with XRE-family HTH domain
MREEVKREIAESLRQYLKNQNTTQSRFSKLAAVGEAQLSHIRNDKFSIQVSGKDSPIDDKYFLAIARVTGYKVTESYWFHLDTRNYSTGELAMTEAKLDQQTRLINGKAGTGKSYMAQRFVKENPNETYLIAAKSDYSPKEFMLTLAETLGVKLEGRESRAKIRKLITQQFANMQKPLLIIDEAEELSLTCWTAVKDLLVDLEDRIGLVILGADKPRKPFLKMVMKFEQIATRLQQYDSVKHFETLSKDDIKAACREIGKGFEDKAVVDWLVKYCEHQQYRELRRYVSKTLQYATEANLGVSLGLMREIFKQP